MSIIQAIVGSSGAASPRFVVDSWSSPINEGVTTYISYSFYNYATPTTLYWTINNANTDNTDFTGDRSGSFVASGNGSGSFSYTTASDLKTEGQEYFYVYIGTSPGGTDLWTMTIYLNDTSTAPPFVYNDFTIEWWQYMESSQTTPYPRLFDVGYYPTENPGISFENTGVHLWGGGNNVQDIAGAGNIANNTWQHWAIERYNGVISLYSGGTNILTSNNVGTREIKNLTDNLLIGTGSGAPFNGKVADFHWVKGYAKYQGNFTAPTSPIQPRLGTKLLLSVVDDANKIVDATGRHTFTNSGATFSSASPYSFPAPVSRSTGAGGQDNQGYYLLQFSDTYTDLLVVKAGWLVSDGQGFTDTVYIDSYNIQGAITVKLTSKVSPPLPGTYTFTNPAQTTGSLVFNNSYISTPASSDWAIDATDVVTDHLTLYLDVNQLASYSGSGSTWTNLAGAGNITLYGSPLYSAGPPANLNFDGTTAQYGVGSTPGVIGNSSYTKLIWAKFNAIADNNMVSSDNGGHYVFMATTNHIYCGHGAWGSTTINPSVATVTTGTWYMIAVTFDTTNGMSLYINGQLDHNYNSQLTGPSGDGSVNIGCYAPAGNTLNGKMGLVMCYDRALTAQEVLDNFNGTRNRYGI